MDAIAVSSFSFQPTPSARRVTVVVAAPCVWLEISTHTLRKEGDQVPC